MKSLAKWHWQTILLHIILWSAPLLLPLYIHAPSELLEEGEHLISVYLLLSGILVGCFYLHYCWIIPTLIPAKKYVLYGISIFGLVLLYALIEVLCGYLIGARMGANRNVGFIVLRILFLRFVAGMLVSWVVYLAQLSKRTEQQRQLTELKMLRSRINPHFLYNTLNSLYSMALKKSDRTAESIAKLSDIMRYFTEGSTNEKVSLAEEITYMREYVELQQLRLTGRTKILLQIEGNAKGRFIPPLLTLNFVENAFKYGVSNETSSEITIRFLAEEHGLSFFVYNSFCSENNAFQSSSVGIRDVKDRLEIIYKSDFSLNHGRDGQGYKVEMKIPYV